MKDVQEQIAMYHLDYCVWEITLACCFSCKYCGSRGGQARYNELTTEECLDVSRQLGDLGCGFVSLIGGEVFMRPDWDVIAKSIVDNGMNVAIITNGFMLTEEILAILKNLKVESIAVSIDGIEVVHDKYRSKGSYKRAIKCIETLIANDIRVSVISTLNGESGKVENLELFYEVLKKYNLMAWQIQSCSPMGNASNSLNTIFDHAKVLDFVSSKVDVAPFIVGVADNIGYFTDLDGYLRGNPNGQGYFGGCAAGISAIGIDSIGNVRGCESLYGECFIEGNLRQKKLADIWNNPDGFAYNRKFNEELLTGRCHECPYGFMCAGGCRSYNYFTHGKLYEAKYCVRNKPDIE